MAVIDELPIVVKVLSVLVAIVSAVISAYFALKSKQRFTKSLAIQKFNFQQSYRSAVVGWADEVVMVMSECVTICELDPERVGNFFDQRNRLRTRLSELIDRGRWFFENDKVSGFGHWKQGAYQGISPKTISCIKDVLYYVERLHYLKKSCNDSQRQPIVNLKRNFVSEIQDFVQPATTYKEFERIAKM